MRVVAILDRPCRAGDLGQVAARVVLVLRRACREQLVKFVVGEIGRDTMNVLAQAVACGIVGKVRVVNDRVVAVVSPFIGEAIGVALFLKKIVDPSIDLVMHI